MNEKRAANDVLRDHKGSAHVPDECAFMNPQKQGLASPANRPVESKGDR